MLFVFSLFLAALFALTGKFTIKRHPYLWYVGACLLSLFVGLFPFSRELPDSVSFFLDLFRRGTFACALWCVVMWTGALPNGSRLIRRLMPVRGELSILAAILTLSHNMVYGKIYSASIHSSASGLPANQLAACVITILLLIIMIPLTILSFPRVRRCMKAKRWKQIQRFAYLFYALLYVHIMLLFVPLARNQMDGYYVSVIAYTAVFLGYAICRIRKWYFLKKKPTHKRELTSICFGLFLTLMLIVCAVCAPKTVESFALIDGTYQGKAYGYDGAVKATVTIEGGKITQISCWSEESDLWYFEKCEETVIREILDAQDTEVDTVSGATYSSNGIKKAVLDALSQAGPNE